MISFHTCLYRVRHSSSVKRFMFANMKESSWSLQFFLQNPHLSIFPKQLFWRVFMDSNKWYRIYPAFFIKLGGTPSSLLLILQQMSLPTMEIYRAFLIVPPWEFNFYFNGSFCISRQSIYIHQIVGLVLDRTWLVDFCLKVSG